MIKKVKGDFIKEITTDADNYEVTFPPNASPEEKLLILGATMMIDYRYYEDTNEDLKKQRRRQFNYQIQKIKYRVKY